MKFTPGLLYVHPSLGLFIVISHYGNTINAYSFEKHAIIPLSSSYVSQTYDLKIADNSFTNIKDIIDQGGLDAFFDSITADRAKNYINDNRIYIDCVTDKMIAATITGSYRYKTKIYYEEGIIHLNCDCPVDGSCKHLYALKEYIKRNDDLDYEDKINVEDNKVDISSYFEISSEFNFDNLTKLERLRKKIYKTGIEPVIKYFLSHDNKSYHLPLSYCLCFMDMTIYSNILNYILIHPECARRSYFLSTIRNNHDNYFKEGNRRYQYTDDNKAFIFYTIGKNFETALEHLRKIKQYGFRERDVDVVYGYYFKELYEFNHEILSCFLLKDSKVIVETYKKIHHLDYSKDFYIKYNEALSKNNMFRDDIDYYDEFKMYVSGGEDYFSKYKNKKIERLIEIINELIKEHKDIEVAEYLYSITGTVYFSYSDYLKIISLLEDNTALIKIFKKSKKDIGDDYA